MSKILNDIKIYIANRGYLVAYCLFSYASYLSIMQLMFGGIWPEVEVLVALIGAPLLFQIWPILGMPLFAFTHSLWTGFLALSIMQWLLLEPEFRLGDLSPIHLTINSFFTAANLFGLVWLTLYSNINRRKA